MKVMMGVGGKQNCLSGRKTKEEERRFVYTSGRPITTCRDHLTFYGRRRHPICSAVDILATVLNN